MNGAGFIKDMIAMSRSNRRLLKGDGSHTYQNFDKSYITNSIISRKVPKFKKATPEYLAKLKVYMQAQKKQQVIKSILAITFAFGVVGFLAIKVFLH